MPLKIIIVGAGIAGLCAGVALRQAGHHVEIFEKSRFAAEIGAALAVTSNGARVLSRLGFSFIAARAVRQNVWDVVHGDTLGSIQQVDLSSAEQKFGAPIWSVHRVDLHNELLRLATSQTDSGYPIRIHLASEVTGASPDGSIVLKDGSKHAADLVVGADGLHSVLKGAILGDADVAAAPTGLSAFRFLIDTQHLRRSESLSATLDRKGPGIALLADTKETVKERHMIWYSCRDGQIQNFVGIHPTREIPGDDEVSMKTSMLQEFSHFSPAVVEIIRESSNVKCWPLFVHEPFAHWSKGRLILIGDAAHPMLPFGGQGANSAIEDGGSLGYIFNNIESANLVPERLRLFEKARKARASRIQILSSVRVGRENEVTEKLHKYADPPGSNVPSSMIERTVHDYSFDAFQKCEEVLAA